MLSSQMLSDIVSFVAGASRMTRAWARLESKIIEALWVTLFMNYICLICKQLKFVLLLPTSHIINPLGEWKLGGKL